MYRPILTLLPLAATLACLPPAHAQVTSNLDDLPQAKTAPKTTAPGKAAPAATHPASPHSTASQPKPSTNETASAPPPSVPVSPPPAIVLPPPFVPIQTHPPVPPLEIQPVKDAKSSTAPLPDSGLRVLFAPNTADLNAETLKSLQSYAQTLTDKPEQRIILTAYATLPGDDISMPRRISLARTLSIRSILINAGIATTRIYPRAMGRPDKTDTAPEDRLDITLESNPPAQGQNPP